ncbi:VapE domain-containing protein [Parabacteroides sp. PF5-6]|uniref:VapE domain-containing protein n=1 Tax=Parabacteroides sp. PF5-6 TaxID=1742403 RepID=UPI002406CD8E|nr:VapE domain-containing protein [Parabacteroides sp. PF5-6]
MTRRKAVAQKAADPIRAEEKKRVAELLCRVEAFLNRRYEFRFNVLSEVTEFRLRKHRGECFRPVGKRELNSLCIAARKDGIDCWDRDVSRYIHSEDIPAYHPIRGYVEGLPSWDGVDRVRELALRVAQSDLWVKGFHLWMRAMVAQWMEMDRKYGNSVAPVLISGRQGLHKSTFCKMLLPEVLQMYYTDSFALGSGRNAVQKLAAFGLINLDELDQFSEQQMALLKNLMQMAGLNIRKAYKKSHSALPRMASFIGTSNRRDLLCDPTGSRRFLCVEVEEKIVDCPIAYDQLYAQLKQEVLSGERYWFSAEEEKALQRHNQAFQRRNMAEDLFWKHFRLPQSGEAGTLLSAADIYNTLKKDSPAVMREVSALCFGKTLLALGIERVHTKYGNSYKVVRTLHPNP